MKDVLSKNVEEISKNKKILVTVILRKKEPNCEKIISCFNSKNTKKVKYSFHTNKLNILITGLTRQGLKLVDLKNLFH